MKVLLLNAPVFLTQQVAHRAIRPVAPATLCAVLNQTGHEAVFIDADALEWDYPKIEEAIKKINPDVIGMTVLYNNRFAVFDTVNLIKKFENIRLIAGGPFATTNPDDLLAKGFDAVCIGEGENVIGNMLLGSGKFYGEAITLDTLPLPDYDNCFPSFTSYGGLGPVTEYPDASLLVTRGCRHKCGFCSDPLFFGQVPRLMSPNRVYQEIELLKSKGVKHVYLYSDELVGSSRVEDAWLEKVCKVIKPLNLTYKCQGRCNKTLQESTLDLMYAAGFRAVWWGVESFSPKILKAFHKAIEPEDIWRTLRLSKKAGLLNSVFIMVGGIDETAEDFEITRKNLLEMKQERLIASGNVSIMQLEPGAPLWERAKNEGWVEDKSFNLSHFEPCLNVPWASKEEIQRRQLVLYKILSN